MSGGGTLADESAASAAVVDQAAVTVPRTAARRAAVALLLSVALGATGLLAALLADALPVEALFDLPWWGLLLGYLVAERCTLGFPRRRDSILVALSQFPLALGVLLVMPLAHLGVRLVATLVDCTLRRRGPLKSAVNLGLAGVEVGVAVGVVALVQEVTGAGGDGPVLWAGLLLGLVLAGTVSQLSLSLMFLVLGRPRRRSELTEPLVVEAVSSTVFAGLAVLTVEAAAANPWSLGIVAALAGFVAVSYRGYRRVVAQQRATEDLYAFVKVLGPVDVEQPEALHVLERVRDLLYVRHLELVVADGQGGLGRSLTVRLGGRPQVREEPLREPPADGPDVQADAMVTPLLVGGTLLGLLRARHRVTNDRGFDMRDLRLFETVATELAVALDRGRLLRDLGRAASTDPMTGLPNLHSTTRRLDELLREHGALVLASVSVDSFREVNDTLGHEVGDDLLREVARRLHAYAPSALIGRTGGGRYAVAVPPDEAAGDAGLFGLGLRAAVEGGAELHGIAAHVRVSVGIVLAPEHGQDAGTLLRRAETAMYSARSAHGGPVVWERAYEVQGQRRLAVVAALREALEQGAVAVAFQPKVSAETGSVHGVEALARWTHPALGTVEPGEFVPLAEASGLMGPLTSTVLRQALTACRGWHCDGSALGVSVNVSADTLQDGGFVTEVASILRSTGVSADRLMLELTEDVVVADPQLAAERMHELQSLGVRLSVDDFGTGYSSLIYLKGFPLDEVKIDRGFVAGLVHDAGDQAVVRAVVDIAHTLGLRVVAEGVEQDDQHGLLRRLGVDEEQGYLHARPMPAREMAAWLLRQDMARRSG